MRTIQMTLDDDLVTAVETSQSLSKLVNDAIKESLAEDAEDIAAFEERVKEPLISYETMMKRLKKDGRI